MASEEKITNKIIPLKTIIDVANYLEDQREEYQRLYERDKQKNEGLRISEQVYDYKGDKPKVQYTIRFKDGREITEEGYNWFIGMLNNINSIEKISIYFSIHYSTNAEHRESYEFKHLYTWVHFLEDTTSIRVDGKGLEEQIYRVHSYLKGIVENNDDRYNTTVKNRKFRIQSLCFSIGFILSYIIYFVLRINIDKIPVEFANYLENKFVIVFGQWFISAITGNVFGLPIMLALYRNILPKAKFSHYKKNSFQKVYVDNLDDYISHNEVQIGKFANNGKNRETIEKMYKITSKIVLVQIIISILLFLILK